MNTAQMTVEQKANFEAMEYHFKRDCRRTALQMAMEEVKGTGGELLTIAEDIYQWLIKTED